MWVKIIAFTLILSIISIGCKTTSDKTFKEEISGPSEKIVEAIMVSGDVIQFDREGGKFIPESNTIVGFTKSGTQKSLPMDDVLYVRIRKIDPILTTLLVIGGIATGIGVVVLIILLTKQSCPFIYSFDGENYVFDAEPLGGAVTEGLTRTELSKMKHIKALDGKYKFMISNEVNETQYVDLMKLVVVDHTPETEMIADYEGNLTQVTNVIKPTSAKDENGRDLMKFLDKKDFVNWISIMPKDSSFKGKDLRNHLTFEFPKPKSAKSAKLVFNIGTSQWGSNMIRELLQLRGNKVQEYYEDINKNNAYKRTQKYFEKEETYYLSINVKSGNQWINKGWIHGAGPLMIEDRILNLDLSDIKEEKLVIKFNPPIGFWSMDFIGVTYDDCPQTYSVRELNPVLARDASGNDISSILDKIDKKYQTMPNVGDRYNLEFNSIPEKAGMARTIFMKTNGYYELHLDTAKPSRLDLLTKIVLTPSKIVEYSLEKYLEWRNNPTAKK